jgi:hypothetical protein
MGGMQANINLKQQGTSASPFQNFTVNSALLSIFEGLSNAGYVSTVITRFQHFRPTCPKPCLCWYTPDQEVAELHDGMDGCLMSWTECKGYPNVCPGLQLDEIHIPPPCTRLWRQPLISNQHDYIIILLYLGCMTSSGQMDIPKLYNSVSFGPNKKWSGQFNWTINRSISTKIIRNWEKFELSISVAQKWWCLGVSHHI